MFKYISVDDLRAATTKRNQIWNTITDASGRGLDEIIDSLPSANEKSFEWCNNCKEYDLKEQCCHRFTKVIRNTIDEIRNEQRWIPVSESIPQREQEVLVYADEGGFFVGYIDAYDLDENGNEILKWIYDDYTYHDIEDVLAWMSLPAPYKEGD